MAIANKIKPNISFVLEGEEDNGTIKIKGIDEVFILQLLNVVFLFMYGRMSMRKVFIYL